MGTVFETDPYPVGSESTPDIQHQSQTELQDTQLVAKNWRMVVGVENTTYLVSEKKAIHLIRPQSSSVLH